MQLSADALANGCRDDSFDAGVTLRADLEPLAGPGAPVKPAVYQGGRYQSDRRWWGDGDRPVGAIVIDNEPSQANRAEQALKTHREALGLPELVLDLSQLPTLPVHLPRQLSSFDFPHRNADAYLRDAILDGSPFPRTVPGTAIFLSTDREPLGLFEWMPQALSYGFWQSHLGSKRQQSKMARAWVSTIVGYDPAVETNLVPAVKGDPLNLSVSEGVQFTKEDQLDWSLTDTAKAKGRKTGDQLSAIGHGQALSDEPAPGPISFRCIEQRATISFARLRTVTPGDADANAAGRALLAALALAGHTFASGRAMSLRSGCDLRPVNVSWTWLGSERDEPVEPLTPDGAVELVRDCARRADAAGLPVGSRWRAEPLRLDAGPELAKVIASAWPLDWPEVA
jgi:CRISPR-associated protein Csb1